MSIARVPSARRKPGVSGLQPQAQRILDIGDGGELTNQRQQLEELVIGQRFRQLFPCWIADEGAVPEFLGSAEDRPRMLVPTFGRSALGHPLDLLPGDADLLRMLDVLA